MRAITAMSFLADHAIDDFRFMFPIPLPQLNFSDPMHIVVWSKLRVFLQNLNFCKEKPVYGKLSSFKCLGGHSS